MHIYNVNGLPTDLIIGRQTETGVLDIHIDCAPWLAIWPELTLSIWVTPPGGAAAYPAPTHMEGDVLVWDVNSADTAVEGKGTMEVMGLAEGLKKLSSITTTQVLRTTTNVTGEAPDPLKSWSEDMLRSQAELTEQIGDLSALETTNKTNLVAAINEAAKTGSGGGGTAGVGIVDIRIVEV